MIAGQIDTITKDDIDTLVSNGVREGRGLEYKCALPGNKDDEKKEFLADVSSFANSSGGDLLYGVDELRDAAGKPTGVPREAEGLAAINTDQEIRRLESMIRDGIEPRVLGLRIRAIDGFSQGPVIVIRVPHSWAAPHMVTYKASPRFFARTSAGKMPLDVHEIRAAFLQSESLPARIRAFREMRLERILANLGPVPLASGALAIAHVSPINGFDSTHSLDVASFVNGGQHLAPFADSGYNHRVNLDGYLAYTPCGSHAECCSYSQAFRNGAIEAVDVLTLGGRADEKGIASTALERDLIKHVTSCLKIYKVAEIYPPFVVMLSLARVTGHILHVALRRHPLQVNAVDRDVLLIPEVVIDEAPNDAAAVAGTLRPVFDLLWQSFGFPRCFDYNDAGEWKPN